MSRSIVLRLSDSGVPLNTEAVHNGVLLLPALAPAPNHQPGAPLFHLVVRLNAASLVARNGTFLTNLPTDAKCPIDRNQFQEFPIVTSFHQDVTIDVPIYRPGPYCYFIRYDGADGTTETPNYYFTVPPQLFAGNKYVPFNAINIQTVVSKWAGPLDNWNSLFGYIAKKGYNMIHFPPLQERGSSNSPYSIYDQTRFDPNLFPSNDQAILFIKKTLGSNGLMSMTDVVWNHTADNSAWLRDCPDAGYNAETAPHLRAAIELDQALLDFSDRMAELGLPTEISSEHDLDAAIAGVQDHVLNPLALWQYYVFDTKETILQLEALYSRDVTEPSLIPDYVDVSNLKRLASFVCLSANIHDSVIMEDRFSNKLDTSKLLGILLALVDKLEVRFDQISQKAIQIVDEINVDLYAAFNDDMLSVKNQLRDRIRFLRLADNGPKLGPITKDNKLTEAYFTTFEDKKGKKWALANNGWIWGGNPLVDFASSCSKAYIRREVIVWCDCVKLRYGTKYEDSPRLWDRMLEYTTQCATAFDSFRLDNCHSTPLHVGEALLDRARSVNPNLYVVAELFTGSEEMDKIFVERLGINSLIREAMQAWSVEELSRLVHKHGGRPIGSLSWLPLDEFSYPADQEPAAGKYPECNSELEIPKVLSNQAPHALFMDCTHDNQTPAQIRTVEDTLSTAALVAFCSSAVGTTFGYDETYPKLLDVVGETRQYGHDYNSGIGKAKLQLNAIRKSLALESEESYNDQEMYIHHEGQYITIQRYNTITGEGWFLIARSKFEQHPGHQVLSPVELAGTLVKAEFSYTLKQTGDFVENDKILTGIPTELVELDATYIECNGEDSVIRVTDSFAPGSIAVFSTKIPTTRDKLDKFVKEGAVEASLGLSLFDLNAILYKCEPEERDASGGMEGTYNIPDYGNLVYAGLEGWIAVLKDVIWKNELAHPICNHLRQGLWAADYVVNRLDKYAKVSEALATFQDWLRSRINAIRKVPYFLRPHYFALIVGVAYEAARFRVLRQMDDNIKTSTNFVQSLALTSVQMCGYMNNTSLLPDKKVPCLAAGLPHFSNDYMRCWGRDVFISFRGLLIVPGRFEEAKQHIFGFAKTLKHGLIPNLLDAGRNPRYNARDAAWFFAQAVQEFVTHAPNGEAILDEKVSRRFPLDDTYIPWEDERAFSYETSIRDILYEILTRHAKGISYREANAGPNLDSQMTDQGFNVSVGIDWETGLVHGGSQWNCGTWMDKMGESAKAGSRGYPGTPRDGAAVELQGLLKSTLRFVNQLHERGLFEYTEVEKDDGTKITLRAWEELIQQNFERCFYIPEDPSHDSEHVVNGNVVNRRGIYKDLFRSGKEFEDYQLRPNFPIAMCVAPELFTPEYALAAINNADNILRGPVGMRTLDPSDWNYHPDYNNSEDSDDFATSKGRNYHQGPEWVWCFGYFIRAFLYFHHMADKTSNKPSAEILTALNDRIKGHIKWIRESPWAGITELTNKNGAFCHDSSPTQAWSTSCLLDLYYDLWNAKAYA